MRFIKMEGCGNDYIYVDGAAEQIPYEKKPEIVRKLSDRHFGIGGDGIIFINPSDVADFEMEMWNSDGTRGAMCGNGIRCVAKFVYDKGMTDKEQITVVSAGSVKYLDLTVEDGAVKSVRVDMGAPILEGAEIPVKVEGNPVVAAPITVQGKEYKMTCVSMGNPHAVVFPEEYAQDLSDLPIREIGPYFEHHDLFPDRTNTEFVKVVDRRNVNMRVWERGAGETLACGTGACAVGVSCILNGLTEDKMTVHLLGGDLEIEWDREKNRVFMTGPAEIVFEGEVKID
jgi:diaminopimelate epimerase